MLEECLPAEKAGEVLNNEAILVDWFRRYVWKDIPLDGAQDEGDKKNSKASSKPKKGSAASKKKAAKGKKNETSQAEAPSAEKATPVGLQVEEGLSEEEVTQVVTERLDDAVEAMLQRCMESSS